VAVISGGAVFCDVYFSRPEQKTNGTTITERIKRNPIKSIIMKIKIAEDWKEQITPFLIIMGLFIIFSLLA
jgi:predicted transcriptional regulator